MTNSYAAKKVLLVGWDAADWKIINPLLDAGLMPNLNQLVNEGVMGSLSTLRPCLSPILWTSIATGKTAEKHGITGFVEPNPGGNGVRPATSTSRTTKAIWNILSQNGYKSLIVNWFASHPAEPVAGVTVSNRFFEGLPVDPTQPWNVIPDSVHPAELQAVFSGLRMYPAEFTKEDLKRLIPEIGQIDLDVDDRPTRLCQILASTVSVHSVFTAAMQSEPWDFAAVYYNALDLAGHLFMPFHPPQLPAVTDEDFRVYQHVMREVYLFHDGMLGRLLELAGDDTTVMLVSDHGFHSDHMRPRDTDGARLTESQAIAWHRKYGVIAIRGSGIKKDERIYGATLLDVTPTLLTLFDIPVGRDMDGRPLLQSFVELPQDLQTIPSWDSQPGNDGLHPPDLQQEMLNSPEVIEQLIALGYLSADSADSNKSAKIADYGSRYCLSIVHASHGRPERAMELLEGLHAELPDNSRYALALAKVYGSQDQYEKCIPIIESLESKGLRTIDGDLLLASALFAKGRKVEAFDKLADTEKLYPPSPAIFNAVGGFHLGSENWQPAVDVFAKTLELDDEDPQAHNGMAQALLQLKDWNQAADHALQAVGLLFFFPQAHFHLGMAFKGMRDNFRAIRSLDIAVTQSPGFLEAHRELASIYEQLNNVPQWLNHKRMADGFPPLQ